MAVMDEIQALLDSPGTSHWLREALSKAVERDPVDAANDAEVLAELLTRRCDELLQS